VTVTDELFQSQTQALAIGLGVGLGVAVIILVFCLYYYKRTRQYQRLIGDSGGSTRQNELPERGHRYRNSIDNMRGDLFSMKPKVHAEPNDVELEIDKSKDIAA